jgi:hypothetical protein
MTLTATFLSGARSRLLPASVPFRFFAVAAFLHALMWLALFGAAGEITHYRGGIGPPLAAVHILTLGVFMTTAIGASVQLLPVATRRTLVAVWPIKLVFWLVVPGLLSLLVGMCIPDVAVAIVGAGVTAAGLLIYAALLAENLRRARGLPVVVAYGWTAAAALALLVVLGVALSSDYAVAWLPDHADAALAHLILGAFGVLGMLVLGFSHILVPMFALSSAPASRPAAAAFVTATVALVAAVAAALLEERSVLAAAAIGGLAATAAHIMLMRRVLQTGMRKRLGLSFVLIKASWVLLAASLLVGLFAVYGFAGPRGPTLFGLLVLGGWLLTFLLGILQRILPFLASMHAVGIGRGTPPLLSELAASSPLKLHALCHTIALVGLIVAIILDSGALARSASAVGCLGAIAFAWFTARVIGRIIPPPGLRRDRSPMSPADPKPRRPI